MKVLVRLLCFLLFCFFSGSLGLSSFSAVAPPTPDALTCNFYVDLERDLKCATNSNEGSDYLISFGYRYCGEFLKARNQWNEPLKKWSVKTSQCLQEALANSPEHLTSCRRMEAWAFDTHLSCYQKAGFCSLSKADRGLILEVIGRPDTLKNLKKSLVQFINVSITCDFGVDETMRQIYRWLFTP